MQFEAKDEISKKRINIHFLSDGKMFARIWGTDDEGNYGLENIIISKVDADRFKTTISRKHLIDWLIATLPAPSDFPG